MAGDMFEGSAITPYLITKGAEEAIAFYVAAFGAVENYRLVDPQSGKIGHADLAIGDASFMLADEHPSFGALSPPTIGGTPVKLHPRGRRCRRNRRSRRARRRHGAASGAGPDARRALGHDR